MRERYQILDIQQKLLWNLRDLGKTLHGMSEGRASQKRILVVLLRSGGMTQQELTERLEVRPGSASEVIGKLEGAGLLLRTPSSADRRTADVHLTEAGERAARAAEEERRQRRDVMFSCLTEEEKETLLGLLERLSGHWEERFAGAEDRGCGRHHHRGGGC